MKYPPRRPMSPSTPRRLAPFVGLALVASLAVSFAQVGPAASAPTDQPSVDRAIAAADAVIQGAKVATASEAFVRTDVAAGDPAQKLRYVTYDRKTDGVRVVGGEVIVVADEFGKVRDIRQRPLGAVPAKASAKISAAQAKAQALMGFTRVEQSSAPELVVLAEGVASPVLAWQVQIMGQLKGKAAHQVIWVDARSGAIAQRSEQVHAMDHNTFYYGKVSLNSEGQSFVSTTAKGFWCEDRNKQRVSPNPSGPGAGMDASTGCAEAQFAVETQQKMLKAWLGRDGIDGRGNWVPAEVGLEQANAYWTGPKAVFGYGPKQDRQMTTLDVVGHEYGHGILQRTGKGFFFEVGIVESVADMFGASTEAFANHPLDKPDYTNAEMVIPGGDLKYLRPMWDPALGGSPACYGGGGGVEEHRMAGPLNHWFYLLAEGTDPTTGHPASKTCNGATGLVGIGMPLALKVVHDGLLRRTGTLTHPQLRGITLSAAKDLQPGSCTLYNRVKAAWDGISVPAKEDPGCSGGDTPLPTQSPSVTPKPTPSVTPSPTLTPTPSVTPSPTQTASPTPTATQTPAPVGGEVAVTDANVDAVLARSSQQPVVVVVGATWSGMTQRILPKFREKLSADNNSWVLARVDGDLHKKALAKFNIKAYPTVIVYKNGQEMADPARWADGSRSQDSVNAFIDDAVAKWKAS